MKLYQALFFAFMFVLVGCASTQTAMPTPQNKPKNIPTVALVLGGGGAKGFAHVGVLKALEGSGIKPDMIVASSAGAIVGTLYASGKSAEELETLTLTTNENALLDPVYSKQGLFAGDKLRAFINEQAGHKNLENLPIKTAIVATDNQSGERMVFTTGETGLIVQASSAIPKLFIAPRIPDKYGKKYSDGGQVSLVPSVVARELGADVVIAVNVLNDKTANANNIKINQDSAGISASFGNKTAYIPVDLAALKETPLPFGLSLDKIIGSLPSEIALPKQVNFWQILDGGGVMSEADKLASDIIITPNLSQFNVINNRDKRAMITKGEQATLMQLDGIKNLLKNYTNSPRDISVK